MNVDNLDAFPPANLDAFCERIDTEQIREVVLTGTTTDPQLYRHEERLLDLLRARLHPAVRLSVHTNGVLALRKLHVFNRYDRACISFPSFRAETYEKMMGSRRVPDLAAIVAAARIPVKVSCVVDEHNAGEIDDFVATCHAESALRRLVVRRLHGDTRRWPILRDLPGGGHVSRQSGDGFPRDGGHLLGLRLERVHEHQPVPRRDHRRLVPAPSNTWAEAASHRDLTKA